MASVVILAVVVGMSTTRPFQPVKRARLYRFARRQSLPITVENGALVLRYLATTRRWRGGGMLVSVVASAMWSSLAGAGFTLQGAALFAGWFVGAVIAEWRVGLAVDAAAGARAALLVPRRLANYLPWPILAILAAAATAVFGIELAALTSSRHDRLDLGAVTLASIAVAAVIGGVARHVLRRAQPLDEPGVLDADDALRSRSLRVLAGSGIALAGYALSITVTVAVRHSTSWGTGAVSVGTALGNLLLPIVGVLVATAPSRTRRHRIEVSVTS